MEPNPTQNTAAEQEPAAPTLHEEHTPQRTYETRHKGTGIQTRGATSRLAVGQAVAIHSTLLRYFLGITANGRSKGTR